MDLLTPDQVVVVDHVRGRATIRICWYSSFRFNSYKNGFCGMHIVSDIRKPEDGRPNPGVLIDVIAQPLGALPSNLANPTVSQLVIAA